MSRATPVLFAVVLIVQTIALPIAAATETCTSSGITYNCITEEAVTEKKDVLYGQDGTAFKGNATVSAQGVFAAWPTQLRLIPIPNDSGVRVGAYTELPLTSYHLNASGSNFAYTPSVSVSHIWSNAANPDQTFTNLVPAVRYTLTPQTSVIMNGASVFFFRGAAGAASPVTRHVLDITNADTNEVVFRTTTWNNSEADIINDRAYYRLNLPFFSQTHYVFTEYVQLSTGSAPIDSIQVYGTPYQLNALGASTFTTYPGDAVQSSVPMPPAYSFIFLEGLGPAGIERLIEGNSTLPVTNLTFYASGRPGADPNHAEFLIPLRHTTPIDVGVTLIVRHTSLLEIAATRWFNGVTGSIQFTSSFSHESGATNQYYVLVTTNLTDGKKLTYNMIPTGQDWAASRAGLQEAYFGFGHHERRFDTAFSVEEDRFFGWVPHLEVVSEDNGTASVTPSLFGVTAGKVVAVAVFASMFFPPTALPVLVFGYAVDGNFTHQGACRALNSIVTPDAQKRSDLFCDTDFLAALTNNVFGLVTPIACAATGVAVATAALAKDLATKAIAAGVGIGAGLLCANGPDTYLPAWAIDLIHIVKRAIEEVGHWVQEVLQVAAWAAELVFPILGLLAYAYVILVPLKIVLLAVGGVVGAIETKGGDPRRSPTFKFIRDTFYLPFWSELVEDKLGLFHAKEAPAKRLRRKGAI